MPAPSTESSLADAAIWQVLAEIEDPELPVAITDLGLVYAVVRDGDAVRVELLPTFTGCPALPLIRDEVHRRLLTIPGIRSATVTFRLDPPWTVDRLSEAGRARLAAHGVSVRRGGPEGPVVCPVCGSTNVILENPFGPTLCRAIYYCRDCRNPLERFKAPDEPCPTPDA
jgi:ring-1,2-phenylacetyl-CoA epoxidase subunit PaaD